MSNTLRSILDLLAVEDAGQTRLQYDVTALRDGRTFSTRRVSVSQGGVVIMESLVSFMDQIDTFDQQQAMPDTADLLADPLLSTCLLDYVSDWTILDPMQVAIGRTWQSLETLASLDHAMWFHRQIDFADWVLYDQRSPGAVGGTGLGCGSIYNRSGALVCTVAQEGYLGRLPL